MFSLAFGFGDISFLKLSSLPVIQNNSLKQWYVPDPSYKLDDNDHNDANYKQFAPF